MFAALALIPAQAAPQSRERTAPLSREPYSSATALAACKTAMESVQKFVDGAIDAMDVEKEFQNAFDQARRSRDEHLWRLLRAVLTGIREQSSDGDSEPAGRPIPHAENEQYVKGVMERTGATTATCTERQYGTGWATVCR
jgi:hypothetical protein